jgi:equilibrative nucleoside transporter 1/2/3
MLNRCYNIPSSIMALLLCFVKPKRIDRFLIINLGLTVLELCALPIFILVPMSENAAFYGTLVLVGCTGVSGASILSSAFSTAAVFGPQHATYTSSGNGCCGVVASLLRIITKASVTREKDEKLFSSLYFFLAAAVILVTLVYLIIKLKRDQALRDHINPRPGGSVYSGNILRTVRVIWVIWLGDFVDFLITLTLFPGYVTQAPVRKPWCTWTPVVVTTVFCIFDWVGRWLPAKILWPTEKWVGFIVYVRLIFFPIFMISLEKVLDLGEPYWTFLWMVSFATTNGYVGTVSVVHGSNHSKLDEDEKRTAGFLMNFAVNGGILGAMFLTFAMPQHDSGKC